MFLRDTGLSFFSYIFRPPGFVIRLMLALPRFEMHPLCFLEKCYRIFLISPLNFWQNSLVKYTIWACSFLCWKVFNYKNNLFNRCKTIQLIYIFLSAFWQIEFFKEFVHFIKVVKFMGINLLAVYPYYHFNVCRVSYNILLFILDICNLRLLFFPQSVCLKVY